MLFIYLFILFKIIFKTTLTIDKSIKTTPIVGLPPIAIKIPAIKSNSEEAYPIQVLFMVFL